MGEGIKVYAKISSIITALVILFTIIYNIAIKYSNCEHKICNLDIVFNPSMILVNSGIVLIVGALILIPLFYYGWSKDTNNMRIRILTKMITLLMPILIIVYLLTSRQNALYMLIQPALVVILLIPLYFFGWKKSI